MPTAMVTFNGRITLPPQVRKDLGLKTGDNIEFVEVEHGRFAISHRCGSAADSDLRNSKAPVTAAEKEADRVS